MSALFSPLALRGVVVPNRLWVSPMCQYSAVDGVPNDWHLVHLAQFASGGAGLIVAEATGVVPEGRISPQDTGLWNEEQEAAWRRIVDVVHARGALVGIQLGHAGRKASTHRPWDPAHGSVSPEEGGWVTEAPSAIAYEGYATPVAMDRDRVGEITLAFAHAARRAAAAGFDLVEIHAAHGYLLHQFLSPLSNARTDAYGGPLENRARLVLEIVRAVRAELGEEFPLLLRISATDHAEGGFALDEAVTVSGWAAEAGVDLVDVSSGGLVAHQRIEIGPGYQVPYATAVRAAGVPSAAVGLITSGAQAEDIVARGDADAVFAGREWLRDPHFALRAAHEVGADMVWPPQYERARFR